jgi:hypothetical protein
LCGTGFLSDLYDFFLPEELFKHFIKSMKEEMNSFNFYLIFIFQSWNIISLYTDFSWWYKYSIILPSSVGWKYNVIPMIVPALVKHFESSDFLQDFPFIIGLFCWF